MRSVGSPRSASAAGSVAPVRATTSPMPAEPRANGTDSPSSSPSCRTSTRLSRMVMMPKMHRSAVRVDVRTPASAASQVNPSPSPVDRAWKTTTERPAPSPYSARLKRSFSPDCRRCRTRAAPAPTTSAVSRWPGAARRRAAASTRSPMEKLWASCFHCQWTTNTSPRAKAAAQSTHGRFRAVGARGSTRTTMTNSVTAAAATVAVSSMIRWDGVSRPTRLCTASTPLVIVVISSGPVRAGPGDAGPGHAGPGHAGPGHAGPGHAGPGHPGPGHPGPGHPGPGHPGPGHAGPGHAGPGHAGPRDAVPVGLVPGAGRPPGRIPPVAAHVLLAGDGLAVHVDVHRPTSELEGTEAGGHGPLLHGVRRGASDASSGEVDRAVALGSGVSLRQLPGSARQQSLHLVRREIRALREQQRRGAGDDRSRLRRAGAAEEPLTGTPTRVVRVQVRPGGPQAHHGLARSDHVGVAHPVAGVGPAGDLVVVDACGAVGVGTTDGDDVRVVGRFGQLPLRAAVARRDHDHDAVAPRLLGGEGQRVEDIVLDTVGAERQVEHTDVQA